MPVARNDRRIMSLYVVAIVLHVRAIMKSLY